MVDFTIENQNTQAALPQQMRVAQYKKTDSSRSWLSKIVASTFDTCSRHSYLIGATVMLLLLPAALAQTPSIFAPNGETEGETCSPCVEPGRYDGVCCDGQFFGERTIYAADGSRLISALNDFQTTLLSKFHDLAKSLENSGHILDAIVTTQLDEVYTRLNSHSDD